MLLINWTCVQIFDTENSSGISQLYYRDNAFSTSQECFGFFFLFFLQATRDTFSNWGLHLCAPTFVHLFSRELSSAHISTGNIAAFFRVLSPNKDEGKLNADGFLVTTFPCESSQKLFDLLNCQVLWSRSLPASLLWPETTETNTLMASASYSPAALYSNTFPYPLILPYSH